MRKAYPSFYRPSPEESERTWRGALFALDASFLLNLYRYSERTRADVLATLTKLRDQLWVPHQAGLEFHRNRPAVMHDQARNFTAMRSEFENARKRVESLYRDPAKDEGDAASLQEAWGRLDDYLAEHEKRSIQPTMAVEDDAVLAAITELLDGRVGQPFDLPRLTEVYTDGALRYARKAPPGFEDENKPEPERYGDLIVWLQMIEQAKSTSRPIIFVTADEKRDWWWIHEGRTLGPLPGLIGEMLEASGQPFWAYKPDQFMRLVGPFVDSTTSAQALQELRDTRAPAEDEFRGEGLDEDIAGLLRSIEGRRHMLGRSIRDAQERLAGADGAEDRLAAEERLADLERRWRRTELQRDALRHYGGTARRSRVPGEGLGVRERAEATASEGAGKPAEIFQRLVEAIERANRDSEAYPVVADERDEDLG